MQHKFCWQDAGTSAKNWLKQLLLWQLELKFLRWKYCHGAMATIDLPSNFNDSHVWNTPAHTIISTQPTSTFSCSKPHGPQKLECSIITQVCDLCQRVHGWLVAALSTVMITLFHQEMSIDAFTIEVWWNFDKMQIIFKAITGSSGYAFWWERTALHSMETVVWHWPSW